jgi:hypothetical protein
VEGVGDLDIAAFGIRAAIAFSSAISTRLSWPAPTMVTGIDTASTPLVRRSQAQAEKAKSVQPQVMPPRAMSGLASDLRPVAGVARRVVGQGVLGKAWTNGSPTSPST